MRLSVLRVRAGFVILVIGLTFALLTEHRHNEHQTHAICASANNTRKAFVDFIDNTLDRSARNTNATLTSPSATPTMRAAAQQNLDSLKTFRQELHDQLGPNPC